MSRNQIKVYRVPVKKKHPNDDEVEAVEAKEREAEAIAKKCVPSETWSNKKGRIKTQIRKVLRNCHKCHMLRMNGIFFR